MYSWQDNQHVLFRVKYWTIITLSCMVWSNKSHMCSSATCYHNHWWSIQVNWFTYGTICITITLKNTHFTDIDNENTLLSCEIFYFFVCSEGACNSLKSYTPRLKSLLKSRNVSEIFEIFEILSLYLEPWMNSPPILSMNSEAVR